MLSSATFCHNCSLDLNMRASQPAEKKLLSHLISDNFQHNCKLKLSPSGNSLGQHSLSTHCEYEDLDHTGTDLNSSNCLRSASATQAVNLEKKDFLVV